MEKSLSETLMKTGSERGLLTQHAALCELYVLLCLAVYGFTLAASCQALAAVR